MKNTLVATITALGIASVASAQTAYHNLQGYTSSAKGIVEFSVLVVTKDGRIAAIGDEDLLMRHTAAKRVDLGGHTVLPGLVDAHAHVLGLGQVEASLDLTGSASLEEAVERIDTYARSHGHEDWISGGGWNQVLWPDKAFPTAADIDAVLRDRPVWLQRIDGHAGWANTTALEIARIDDDTADPIGGRILRDDNGRATGILIDKAMALVEDNIPPLDRDDIRERLRVAQQRLLAEGITGVHDAGVSTANAEAYLSMADDNELHLRIYAMTSGAGEVLEAIGEPIRAYGNDHLDIASVKLYMDGALGSRGAALFEAYSDDPENRGLSFRTPSELEALVSRANRKGFQVAIHAIGDLANRMALDAIDAVQGGKPSPFRNRIEHAQILALEDIPRFAELGVVASMQATHATSDKNMAEDRVGPERIRGGYAWRRLLDSGAIIANGSDFPVELSNPFHGLYAAVTRRDRDGRPDGGWHADQAMTRAEALHSFTFAAAYAANREDRFGSLEPGKWADFIVIDSNYFSIPADRIDDIRVLQTWIGGKKVFDAGEMP